MAKFWELLEESVLVQALLTLGVWSSIVVLVCVGKAIPDILSAGGYTILGFWFGSKAVTAVTKAAQDQTLLAAEAAAKVLAAAGDKP